MGQYWIKSSSAWPELLVNCKGTVKYFHSLHFFIFIIFEQILVCAFWYNGCHKLKKKMVYCLLIQMSSVIYIGQDWKANISDKLFSDKQDQRQQKIDFYLKFGRLFLGFKDSLLFLDVYGFSLFFYLFPFSFFFFFVFCVIVQWFCLSS